MVEFECTSDVTTRELLELVSRRAELAWVDLETKQDFANVLGKILRVGAKRFDMHFVRRDGTWADIVDSWKLKEVTRIAFGGRYITAFERYGEPWPNADQVMKR